MNEKLRIAIRQRARQAVSNDELVRAVFDGYLAEKIEPRSVSLEDMKLALVWAAREARPRFASPGINLGRFLS